MALSSSAGLQQWLERSLRDTPHVDGDAPPGSADQVVRDALHAVRAHFGMDVAFVAEFRDGQRVVRMLDAAPGAAPFTEGHADPLEQTYCQRIVDGRLPGVLPDAQRDPQARELAARLGLHIGAHLGQAIRLRNGELYGTFCCFRTQPDRTLNPRDLATLRLFAEVVTHVLDQQRAAAARSAERGQHVRRMLAERRFGIVYQPVIDVARNALVFYEALARFHAEPVQGPDRWFADAAAVGLQSALERAVMRRALDGLAQIPAGVYLSLNVSPQTLLEPGFDEVFAGAPLQRLMIEVTEHAEIADYAAVARQLAPLRAAGLRLAVDDAGAGFASFRHILQLQPDVIKLDASLIRGIDGRRQSRALAAALIRFAEETGCRIVAEGVETPAELEVLRELQVDKVQGYLLGRPGPLPAQSPA